MKKKIFLFIIFVLFVLMIVDIVCQVLTRESIKEKADSIIKELNSLDLNSTTKLMIVAHPDDDIIWGGSHLIDDNYLVICVTCGVDLKRVEEFKNVMSKTNDDYIMLGYPDKTNGKRDDWNSVYDSVTNSLKTIINYKDWELVVTHNPDGEYGHIQHKMTSKIVTEIVSSKNLMYFGRYYKSNSVPDDLESITDENYNIKVNTLVPLYASQAIIKPYGHMLNHEVWIPYKKWSDNND